MATAHSPMRTQARACTLSRGRAPTICATTGARRRLAHGPPASRTPRASPPARPRPTEFPQPSDHHEIGRNHGHLCQLRRRQRHRQRAQGTQLCEPRRQAWHGRCVHGNRFGHDGLLGWTCPISAAGGEGDTPPPERVPGVGGGEEAPSCADVHPRSARRRTRTAGPAATADVMGKHWLIKGSLGGVVPTPALGMR